MSDSYELNQALEICADPLLVADKLAYLLLDTEDKNLHPIQYYKALRAGIQEGLIQVRELEDTVVNLKREVAMLKFQARF